MRAPWRSVMNAAGFPSVQWIAAPSSPAQPAGRDPFETASTNAGARAARGEFVCVLREGPLVSGHSPSVDVMFHSVAKSLGAHAVGILLTGMGRDGARVRSLFGE